MFISKKKHQEALAAQRRSHEESKQWTDIWDLQSDIETLQAQVKELDLVVRDLILSKKVK